MKRSELAQLLYESVWPGCVLDESLPEMQDNFHRLADTAAAALNTELESA